MLREGKLITEELSKNWSTCQATVAKTHSTVPGTAVFMFQRIQTLMLSWLTGILLCSFLGISEPRKVYVAKQISWHLQTMWLNLLSWAHTESTLAENTLHFVVVAIVHFLIYCVDQFAHCHHHLPQPHTFSSHVLLSHSLVLQRCLLHIRHHP